MTTRISHLGTPYGNYGSYGNYPELQGVMGISEELWVLAGNTGISRDYWELWELAKNYRN